MGKGTKQKKKGGLGPVGIVVLVLVILALLFSRVFTG